MTKRSGRSADNDDVLAAVLNAGTPAVCLVGKAHPFHVETALGVPLDENLDNIRASFAHLRAKDREALFDAEHFFDGYRADPAYALAALHAAHSEGARWIVLCDTNGGTLPGEVARTVEAVIASGIPGELLGIHTHDDTGHAVANSLAAVEAGARQIQGTLNGLGERCGNASLTSLIPTLLLKEPFASAYQTGVTGEALKGLLRASRTLDDILNRVPQKQAPYVGASAFAHKAGLHASAIAKDPTTYEHVDPGVVGNARIVPMSNQAGQSNLRARLAEAGIEVAPNDPRLSRILDVVKEREARGYAFDTAQASFELLARRELSLLPRWFEVERYRVLSERRRNARGQVVTVSEAVVTVQIGQRRITSFHENLHTAEEGDPGPSTRSPARSPPTSVSFRAISRTCV
jgi:2-isopropylmalate synthase